MDGDTTIGGRPFLGNGIEYGTRCAWERNPLGAALGAVEMGKSEEIEVDEGYIIYLIDLVRYASTVPIYCAICVIPFSCIIAGPSFHVNSLDEKATHPRSLWLVRALILGFIESFCSTKPIQIVRLRDAPKPVLNARTYIIHSQHNPTRHRSFRIQYHSIQHRKPHSHLQKPRSPPSQKPSDRQNISPCTALPLHVPSLPTKSPTPR